MQLYLELLRRVLTREIWIDDQVILKRRLEGLDWPSDGSETMVGAKRLKNVEDLCIDVVERGVLGDFMECGTWKGGCAILMAAVLEAWSDDNGKEWKKANKLVWVADSFQGCPKPNPDQYPADLNDPHHTFKFLAVPLEEVKANFKRYGLLTERVHFLPGWFKDTLPGPVEQLSVLRLDGDLYESTWQCLTSLYNKVSPGGYVIIDDYGAVAGCKKAVDDFREAKGITAPLVWIDQGGVYWQV